MDSLDPSKQVEQTLQREKELEEDPIAEAKELKRRARTFRKYEAALRKEIKARREAAARTPVSYNGGKFDADEKSQQKITGAIQLAGQYNKQNSDTWSTQWKLTGNEFMEVTAQDLQAVFGLIGQQVQAAYNREAKLQSQVDAATTIEELKAIDVASGWPA